MLGFAAARQFGLHGVQYVGRGAIARLQFAPVELLEIRVTVDQALLHRDAVDLLLEPVGELARHLCPVVRCDADQRRDLLPVENANLHQRRFCTYWYPNRPLMQRLPSVTSWSCGDVTF